MVGGGVGGLGEHAPLPGVTVSKAEPTGEPPTKDGGGKVYGENRCVLRECEIECACGEDRPVV